MNKAMLAHYWYACPVIVQSKQLKRESFVFYR